MSKPLRLLYVVSSPTRASGGAAHLAALVRGLPDKNIHWDIAHQGTWGCSFKAEQHGGNSFSLPFRDNADLYTLWHLYRIMKDNQYDLVHTHLNRAGWLGGMAARLAGITVINTAHGLDRPMYSRWSNATIAVSRFAGNRLVRQGVPEWKISVVHNGVWTEDFTRGSAAPVGGTVSALLQTNGQSIPTICLVGRLHQAKGQDTAIKAVSLLKRSGVNTKLVLAGDGDDRLRLENIASTAHIQDNVIFLGDSHDVAALLQSVDAFVLPSRRESCPLSLLEAMAASRPCVVSGVGGVPEMVKHGQEALMVGSDDPPRLAGALSMILQNRDLGKQLGKAAAQKAQSDFHAEKMIDETLAVYEELV